MGSLLHSLFWLHTSLGIHSGEFSRTSIHPGSRSSHKSPTLTLSARGSTYTLKNRVSLVPCYSSPQLSSDLLSLPWSALCVWGRFSITSENDLLGVLKQLIRALYIQAMVLCIGAANMEAAAGISAQIIKMIVHCSSEAYTLYICMSGETLAAISRSIA